MGLATFKGGVHPFEGKELSMDKPVTQLKPTSGEMVYPLSQHIGAPAKPLVKVGDEVLVGQKIADAGGFISAVVNCSVSGKVKKIEPRIMVNGSKVMSIIVENDGEYRAVEGLGEDRDPASLSKAEIREIDQAANRLPGSEDVHIFHGRDVFSFTAARLASGAISFSEVGPSYPVSEVVRLALTNVKPLLSFGWAEGGVYNFDLPYGSARINIRNRDFQQLAGFSYGDLFHVTVHDGSSLVYEGDGRYGRTFGEVEDRDSFLVGDIQHGAAQMLRFNTRGNFIREHAPEVERDQSLAVNFRFRFERAS